MKISVASMIYPTFNSVASNDRKNNQNINDYLEAEVNEKIKLVKNNIHLALTKKGEGGFKNVPLFFTLPEFFWNVKWDELKGEEELKELTGYMMSSLLKKLQGLLDEFNKEKYGEIVLLAGTSTVLIHRNGHVYFYENIHVQSGYYPIYYYEPLNYCYILSNINKMVSFWSKRMTSHIDFGKDKFLGKFVVKINELKDIIVSGFKLKTDHQAIIYVSDRTEWSGENYTGIESDKCKPYIYNNILEACPFSINLCLDYYKAPFIERAVEVNNRAPKIDFLLACGMGFDLNHKYPESVQFAIRNDGMTNEDGSSIGNNAVQCLGVHNGRLNGEEIDGIRFYDGKTQTMTMYILDIVL